MSAKKYAADYRIEERVGPSGKTLRERIYQGVWYEFKENPAVLRRFRIQLLVSACMTALLLLPLLLANTGMGRKFYIVLPAAAAFVPVYLLLAGAWRLGLSQTPFTRENRDKTDLRISGASLCLMIFLSIACVGSIVYAVLEGLTGVEIACFACLILAEGLSVFLFTQKSKAATAPVKEK